MVIEFFFNIFFGLGLFLLRIFPNLGSVVFEQLDEFSSGFADILASFDFVLPVKTIVFALVVMINAELFLILFRGVKFIVNLLRGSGA